MVRVPKMFGAPAPGAGAAAGAGSVLVAVAVFVVVAVAAVAVEATVAVVVGAIAAVVDGAVAAVVVDTAFELELAPREGRAGSLTIKLGTAPAIGATDLPFPSFSGLGFFS